MTVAGYWGDVAPQRGARQAGRFQQIPFEAYKARLLERGMSEAMAQATLDMWVAYDRGLDTAEPRTPESTTPTTFRRGCEEVLKPLVLG